MIQDQRHRAQGDRTPKGNVIASKKICAPVQRYCADVHSIRPIGRLSHALTEIALSALKQPLAPLRTALRHRWSHHSAVAIGQGTREIAPRSVGWHTHQTPTITAGKSRSAAPSPCQRSIIVALNERQGRSRHIAADDRALGLNAIALPKNCAPRQRNRATNPHPKRAIGRSPAFTPGRSHSAHPSTRQIQWALGRLLNGQSQTRS